MLGHLAVIVRSQRLKLAVELFRLAIHRVGKGWGSRGAGKVAVPG
jgi:hypothetical protein